MEHDIPECIGRDCEDGKIELVFRLSPEQLTEFENDIGEAELQMAAGSDKRKEYCCDCNNGFRHTIRASHSLSAAWKCFRKCGAFQMRRGRCD